jgi:hypothetical protein
VKGGQGLDILNKIKRLLVRGQYEITLKAQTELDADGLRPQDAIEAILNAHLIKKTIRSRSRHRAQAGEKLYVIEGSNFTGTYIYTKGAIKRQAGEEIFYLLISSKISTYGDTA